MQTVVRGQQFLEARRSTRQATRVASGVHAIYFALREKGLARTKSPEAS